MFAALPIIFVLVTFAVAMLFQAGPCITLPAERKNRVLSATELTAIYVDTTPIPSFRPGLVAHAQAAVAVCGVLAPLLGVL